MCMSQITYPTTVQPTPNFNSQATALRQNFSNFFPETQFPDRSYQNRQIGQNLAHGTASNLNLQSANSKQPANNAVKFDRANSKTANSKQPANNAVKFDRANSKTGLAQVAEFFTTGSGEFTSKLKDFFN
jgi:hypothetical protein